MKIVSQCILGSLGVFNKHNPKQLYTKNFDDTTIFHAMYKPHVDTLPQSTPSPTPSKLMRWCRNTTGSEQNSSKGRPSKKIN